MNGPVLGVGWLFPGGGGAHGLYSGLDVSRPPAFSHSFSGLHMELSERSLSKDLHIPKRSGRFLFLIRRLHVKGTTGISEANEMK